MLTRPRLPRATVLAAMLGAAAVAAPAWAVDLTGHWRNAAPLPPWTDPLVVVEQIGDAVTITYDLAPPYTGSLSYVGTLVGTSLTVTPIDPPPGLEQYSLPFSFSAPDRLQFISLPYVGHTLERCGCYDGNAATGDGCDATCRVEECFACTAEPSTCTFAADGSSCDDGHDCTTGEHCTSGACGGGDAVPSCTDVTGKWLQIFGWNERAYAPSTSDHRIVTSIADLVQRDGSVSITRSDGAAPFGSGDVDPATGEMKGGYPPYYYCGGAFYSGAVSPDGLRYEGLGLVDTLSTPRGCVGGYKASQRGFRCGGGVVDTGDECVVDSCRPCVGDPPVCTPLPDSTPCRSSDPCTRVATCLDGSCVATVSDSCPLCEVCDGNGGCRAAPRNNCRTSLEPAASLLVVRSPASGARHKIRWRWAHGSALSRSDLAYPEIVDQTALCVFDESGASPALLAKKWIPAGYAGFCGPEDGCTSDYGYTCADPLCLWSTGGTPGWAFDADGNASYLWDPELAYFYPEFFTGVRSVRIDVGRDGTTSAYLRTLGEGPFSSATALPLPLRVQLQVEGGACLDTTFGEAGVKWNSDGRFRGFATK